MVGKKSKRLRTRSLKNKVAKTEMIKRHSGLEGKANLKTSAFLAGPCISTKQISQILPSL
jgi:hypothetical protein